jgi:hypothetical protein
VTEIGLFLFLRLATRLLEKHERVTIDVRCGNHDPSASFWTRLWLAGMLRDNPRISVPENYNPYSYYRFGKVLLGTGHGHLAKDGELMGLMASDCGPGGTPGCESFWGSTHYRHWFLGHIHKDTLDEFPGGKVEHVRTFAGRDVWSHGRYRSGRSLQYVLFDPEFGERSRTVCDIRRAKNLLETAK